MPAFLAPLLVIAAATFIAECGLWALAERRLEDLRFPHRMDASHFRFFTMARLRVIAVLHTASMVAILTLCFLFLW